MATVPDFFVEEVRLDAAAARLVDVPELRDFEAEPLEAELFAEDFTEPRLALRDAGFFADERDELLPERDEDDFAAVFLAPDFAEDFEADDFEPEDFEPDDFEADFAAVFLAPDLLAPDLLAPDLLAPDLAEDFDDEVEEDFAAVFFAAVFLAPDLAED